MKKIFTIATLAIILFGCQQKHNNETGCERAAAMQKAIKAMLSSYPSSTLQDIYKSCFQDYFGVAHMLSDRESVKRYIEYELKSADSLVNSYYEPCGWKGNFVRVNLSAIADGCITSEILTDAFIKSREHSSDSITEEWRKEWEEIMHNTRIVCPDLKNFSEDSVKIVNHLANGEYAFHHSEEYSKAHYPHYRIIHHTVFESHILPHLTKK